MDKKGAESSMGIRKLITLIIVVVVIVVVIIGLLGLDVYGFIKNLPDFLNGKENPPDLTEKAVIFGKDVTILLNDGYGRCIVVETESQDSWLKDYGLDGWELYVKQGGEWKFVIPLDYRMDRVTSDQNKEPIGSWIRMQLIRQDLIEACYLDKSDFKNTEILEEEVKLLLSDEDGKCIVYESKEQPGLEHYGIKKIGENFVLYELDENGKWQVTAGTFNDAQIKDAEIANSLIQKEKEIKEYLSQFSVQFCASGDPMGTCMVYDLTGIGENRMYGSKIQNTGWRYDYGMYYVFEKDGSKIIKDSWRYFKDVVSEKINEINSKDQEFIVFRKCVETETGPCYLSSQVSGLGVYGVREGKIYVFNKEEANKWNELSWIEVSGEELQYLVYKTTIKQELSEEC